MGDGKYEVIFAFESFAIERISELIALNDGISKFASFESSIKVVITYTGRIIDFSRFLDATSGCHEGDYINQISFKEPQMMNHVVRGHPFPTPSIMLCCHVLLPYIGHTLHTPWTLPHYTVLTYILCSYIPITFL
jgi:hypothetical protein